MKKLLPPLVLVLALPVGAAAQVQVAASTFPLWLMMRQLTLDIPDVGLDLIIPAAAGCPHDYVLTPQEMIRLSEADILVINGQGLDDFVARSALALAEEEGRDLQLVDCGHGFALPVAVDALEDAAHVYDEHEHEYEAAFNPHGFASPLLYRSMLDRAAAELSELDPDHAAGYQANAEAYGKVLDELIDSYLDFAGSLRGTIQVLTQHSVLDLLVIDAGLQVAGHIQEHEGQEPSAAGLLALTSLIRERGAAVILTEPQYPDKSARLLSDETGTPVLELDPVANGPADAPLDYYVVVMRSNLNKLESLFGQ